MNRIIRCIHCLEVVTEESLKGDGWFHRRPFVRSFENDKLSRKNQGLNEPPDCPEGWRYLYYVAEE